MHFTGLLPRLITGVILLALFCLVLSLGGNYWFLFILSISTIGLWEFYSMFWGQGQELSDRYLGLGLGAFILACSWWLPHLGSLPLALAALMMALVFLISFSRNQNFRYSSLGIILAGLAYIPLIASSIFSFGPMEIIFLIALTVSSDTCAYFIGLRFGKHKIWPKISPKKSIEGSAGGLVGCILVGSILGLNFGQAPMSCFIVLCLILGILAQLGDFFESALKRSREIKDSGTIFPGHGGVLDRMDSLLFVIPVYALSKNFWIFF